VVVIRVFLNVDVLFDDGSVCRVGPDSALANLVAKAPDYVYLPSLNSPYYPGQRVVARRPPVVHLRALPVAQRVLAGTLAASRAPSAR
jgi:hypothetical protein